MNRMPPIFRPDKEVQKRIKPERAPCGIQKYAGAPVVNEKLSCFFPQSFPDLPLRESECRGELFEFLLLPGGEKGVQA